MDINNFLNLRFGMFIHFGLYSSFGRGEWVKSDLQLSDDEYNKILDIFNPDLFSASDIVKLAKDAGMKYIVFTAKHHDGFCLFNSKLTDYNSFNYYNRDFVKELSDECKKQNMYFGLYFSLIDWINKDFKIKGDPFHPLRNSEKSEFLGDDDAYRKFLHGQIEEILINYDNLEIMWFDFSYADKNKEYWQADKILEMCKKYRPNMIINSRLTSSGSDFSHFVNNKSSDWNGDFLNPELIIPPTAIKNKFGEFIPWESCITLNNHWGYVPDDKAYKSDRFIVEKLIECTSKGGNLILNISPDGRGNINKKTRDILLSVGNFLRLNGESIYGATASVFDKPEGGRFTQKDDILYFHALENCVGPYAFDLGQKKIKYIVRLRDGYLIDNKVPWSAEEFKGFSFMPTSNNSLDSSLSESNFPEVYKLVLGDIL